MTGHEILSSSPLLGTAGLARIELPFCEPLRSVRVHRGGAPAPTDRESPSVVQRLLGFHEQRLAAEAERHQTLVEARRTAAAVLAASQETRELVAGRMAEIARLATEIGLAIAREVVGAALDQGLVDPTPFVARSLMQCIEHGGEEKLSIHLAQEDLAVVLSALESDPDLADQSSRVEFFSDRRASRGTVRVETPAGRLLYNPREVLQRISDEVRKAVST